MADRTRVTIIGKGDFGTTLGNVLEEAGQSDFAYCSRAKRGRYEGTYAPEQLDRLRTSDVIVLAVSSKAVNTVARVIQPYVPPSATLLSTVKAIWYDPDQKQLITTTDLLKEYFPNNLLAAMSGPNLAAEIKKKLPTTTWIATEPARKRKYIVHAEHLCRLFRTPSFSALPWCEMKSIEYGGALKNPPAMAAGFIRAYRGYSCNDFGDLIEWAQEDFRVIYNKIAELRFGKKTPQPRGFLSDLVATSLSRSSRNHQFGRDLGKAWRNGKDEVARVMQDAQTKTVEGLRTLDDICAFADAYQIPTLLYARLYGIIFKGEDPSQLNFKELTKKVQVHLAQPFDEYFADEQ